MSTEKHTEKIKCPDCGTIQDATVEHTVPFFTYLHICTKCDFTIMESDWEVVSTEKQLTAVEWLFDKLQPLLATDGDLQESAIMAYAVAKTKERQQLIDAVNNMSNVLIANDVMVSQINNINATPGENYYNETFKTQ